MIGRGCHSPLARPAAGPRHISTASNFQDTAEPQVAPGVHPFDERPLEQNQDDGSANLGRRLGLACKLDAWPRARVQTARTAIDVTRSYYGANDHIPRRPRGKAAPADNPASHSTISVAPGCPPSTREHGTNGQPRTGANPTATAVLASEIGTAAPRGSQTEAAADLAKETGLFSELQRGL
jgi:hypothetical protein